MLYHGVYDKSAKLLREASMSHVLASGQVEVLVSGEGTKVEKIALRQRRETVTEKYDEITYQPGIWRREGYLPLRTAEEKPLCLSDLAAWWKAGLPDLMQTIYHVELSLAERMEDFSYEPCFLKWGKGLPGFGAFSFA